MYCEGLEDWNGVSLPQLEKTSYKEIKFNQGKLPKSVLMDSWR